MTFDNAFWSSISGYLSIGCWLIVFTPQLWENYTRKSGDGLSMTFLVIWLLGDVFNLVGVVMQDLLFTMLLLAVWYTLADIGLIWQVLYYQNTRSGRKLSEDNRETDPLLPTRSILDESTRRKPNQIIPIATLVISTIALIGSIVYYGFTHMGSDDSSHAGKDKTQFQIIPQIMGWTSAVLYIASRVPQIVKNYKDQSTEGLSLAMFFCAVMGNVFFTLVSLHSVCHSHAR
jgi:solute carrier family 66 (lysosomal lysine-arginine transporter), member 1